MSEPGYCERAAADGTGQRDQERSNVRVMNTLLAKIRAWLKTDKK